MNVPLIWVMGPPLSGKGTQSGKITAKYGFTRIDPTALVDSEIANHTANGAKFDSMRDEGREVPLAEIMPLIEKQLMGHRGGVKGFVIDGYPSNMAEAEILEHQIGSPDLIISLVVQEETTKCRCSQHNSSVSRPSLDDYKGASRPVIENYAQITVQVDGEQKPDQIFKQITQKMDELVKSRGHIAIDH